MSSSDQLFLLWNGMSGKSFITFFLMKNIFFIITKNNLAWKLAHFIDLLSVFRETRQLDVTTIVKQGRICWKKSLNLFVNLYTMSITGYCGIYCNKTKNNCPLAVPTDLNWFDKPFYTSIQYKFHVKLFEKRSKYPLRWRPVFILCQGDI